MVILPVSYFIFFRHFLYSCGFTQHISAGWISFVFFLKKGLLFVLMFILHKLNIFTGIVLLLVNDTHCAAQEDMLEGNVFTQACTHTHTDKNKHKSTHVQASRLHQHKRTSLLYIPLPKQLRSYMLLTFLCQHTIAHLNATVAQKHIPPTHKTQTRLLIHSTGQTNKQRQTHTHPHTHKHAHLKPAIGE